MERQFCSDVMRERGEPLAGTGLVAPRVLMMRWKRGDWRVPRFPSAGMSAELLAAIDEAQRGTNGYIGLMDRRDGAVLPALLAFPENRSLDVPLAALPAAIRAWAAGQTGDWRAESVTTLLCCTDGRRDPCCAKNGFTTFKAVLKHADPALFRPVETTHLGGCRFAATLMAMPRRERYGRLSPQQVPDLLRALTENRRYLPAYRGHADLGEAGQVAELAVQRWWAERGGAPAAVSIADPLLPKEKEKQPPTLVVPATIAGITLSVRLARLPYRVMGSCGDFAKGDGTGKDQSRWIASGIDTVEL